MERLQLKKDTDLLQQSPPPFLLKFVRSDLEKTIGLEGPKSVAWLARSRKIQYMAFDRRFSLGGPTRNRTRNLPVMSRLLCLLSYGPSTVTYPQLLLYPSICFSGKRKPRNAAMRPPTSTPIRTQGSTPMLLALPTRLVLAAPSWRSVWMRPTCSRTAPGWSKKIP